MAALFLASGLIAGGCGGSDPPSGLSAGNGDRGLGCVSCTGASSSCGPTGTAICQPQACTCNLTNFKEGIASYPCGPGLICAGSTCPAGSPNCTDGTCQPGAPATSTACGGNCGLCAGSSSSCGPTGTATCQPAACTCNLTNYEAGMADYPCGPGMFCSGSVATGGSNFSDGTCLVGQPVSRSCGDNNCVTTSSSCGPTGTAICQPSACTCNLTNFQAGLDVYPCGVGLTCSGSVASGVGFTDGTCL